MYTFAPDIDSNPALMLYFMCSILNYSEERFLKMNTFGYSGFFKRITDKTFADLMEKYELTYNELSVISYLFSEAGDSAADIVRDTYAVKSHISLSVNSLVSKGYLAKEPDTRNKKLIHLSLTDSAAPIAKEIKEHNDYLIEVFYSGFNARDKKRLETLASRLIENVKESSILS